MKHTHQVSIDISDSSIKVLCLDKEGVVVAYGSDVLKPGIIEKGHIIDADVFSATLNAILEKTQPMVLKSKDTTLRAVVSLPESKLFTHYLTIPPEVKKTDIAAYVCQDAERTIPLEMDEMYWDYHIVTDGIERNATFVGVRKEDLENYVEALTRADVRPLFVGGELFSLGRSLLPSSLGNESYMIIDIGTRTTTIGIFGEDAIANVSVKVQKGGEYFTQSLVKALGIDAAQAEEQKRQYGVTKGQKDKKAYDTLRTCISELSAEMLKAKDYFEKTTSNTVAHIVLSGGTALLPGIAEAVEEFTHVHTYVGDPLSKVVHGEVFGTDTPGIFFANVIGLALGSNNTKLSRINLLAQYAHSESLARKGSNQTGTTLFFGDLYTRMYMNVRASYATLRQFLHKIGVEKGFNSKLVFTVLFLVVSLAFLIFVILRYAV